MPLLAKKVDIGGYTFWSEPVMLHPISFNAAASEAIAVPQIPTKCIVRIG